MASRGLTVAVTVFLLLSTAVFGYFAGTASRTTKTTTSTIPKACTSCVPTWVYATIAALLIVGLAVGYSIRKASISKP
jgi:hypothetical protein